VNAVNAACDEETGLCKISQYDFKELMDLIRDTPVLDGSGNVTLPLSDIYVISDKTKICEKDAGVFYCTETTKVNEDGGNRAFLDLNGVIHDIITNGLETSLELPAWVNAEPGANVSAYSADNFISGYPDIAGYEGVPARLYYLPIFDKFCPGSCECEPTEDRDYVYCSQTNTSSYHLTTFAGFVVTCVQQSQKCDFGTCVPKHTEYDYVLNGEAKSVTVPYNICPGLLNSLITDPDFKGLTQDSTSSIEGYFVTDVSVDEFFTGIDGNVDFGVYNISLSD
jgi:hypothetical protein